MPQTLAGRYTEGLDFTCVITSGEIIGESTVVAATPSNG
ncbi:MAG: hypothetical protein ACI9MR_004486 [Myxococcota bacterium]|jgi:hypothetical protein